jgi:hypothetical protein
MILSHMREWRRRRQGKADAEFAFWRERHAAEGVVDVAWEKRNGMGDDIYGGLDPDLPAGAGPGLLPARPVRHA